MKQLHGGMIDAENSDVNAYIELHIMHNIRTIDLFYTAKASHIRGFSIPNI
jgi:hypothetical protein